MNCKEFQEKVLGGADFTEEMQTHKSSCEICQKWLDKEISTPPQGISKKEWESTLSKLSDKGSEKNTIRDDSENISKKEEGLKPIPNKEKTEEPADDKSLTTYYFMGLKYGIVFGLSIVVGLSIVQNVKEKDIKNKPSSNTESEMNKDNNASNSSNISIATDTEIIQLPLIQPKKK